MAKKSMKEAAAAGTSVFDTIAQGAQYTRDVPAVQDVQNVQPAKPAKRVNDTPAAPQGRPAKYDSPTERLNLRIPTDIKEYLYAAAYRESSPKKTVSVTEYLCQIIREDMERHKGE